MSHRSTCTFNTGARCRFLWLLALLFWSFPAAAEEWIYTVRPGDNLWNLAETYLVRVGLYEKLQRLNNVQRPRYIPPGTRLRFPIAWLKQQPAATRLKHLRGELTVTRKSTAQPAAAQKGDEFHIGDVLRTGADSSATLQFADGSTLIMQADSELTLDTMTAYGKTGMVDTRVRLKHGRVETQVQPSQGPASRYEIRTPAAVAAVRGTNFRVSAEFDRPLSRSEVTEGLVDVSAAATTVPVPAGFGTIAEAGAAPAPPRKLLPPPDLVAAPQPLRTLPSVLRWKPIAGATAYRVQTAVDESFSALIYDQVVRQPSYTLDGLDDADYAFRVRAIDELGLEGLNATQRLTIDARPLAPQATTPTPRALLRTPRPTLHWQSPDPGSGVRVQIARDAAFQDIVADYRIAQATSSQPDGELPPGTYHWRLAALAIDGEQGPYSPAREFTIKAPPARPAAPQLSLVEPNNRLQASWSGAEPGQHYELQLARDAAFKQLAAQQTLGEGAGEFTHLEPGDYYLRVRVVDVDGVAGPFSPTQHVEIPTDTLTAILILIVALLLI